VVGFHEIHPGDHAIEGNLGAIIFNPVASTFPKSQTFILLRWMQNLHQSTWDVEDLSLVTMVTIHSVVIVEPIFRQQWVPYFHPLFNQSNHGKECNRGNEDACFTVFKQRK
jgi:hypothetical protein